MSGVEKKGGKVVVRCTEPGRTVKGAVIEVRKRSDGGVSCPQLDEVGGCDLRRLDRQPDCVHGFKNPIDAPRTITELKERHGRLFDGRDKMRVDGQSRRFIGAYVDGQKPRVPISEAARITGLNLPQVRYLDEVYGVGDGPAGKNRLYNREQLIDLVGGVIGGVVRHHSKKKQ